MASAGVACCVVVLVLSALVISFSAGRYTPDWPSIDSRPLPSWFDRAKFGVFLHWGVYSVPSFNDEWFWYYWKGSKKPVVVEFMKENYRPGFTYADFAPQFTAEFFNATQWAEIFSAAGAKYVVLTSKHHEGFMNWHTNLSFNWNAVDVGPGMDLVGELAVAVRKTGTLKFGLYHSMFEWFNPLFRRDVSNNFTTNDYVTMRSLPALHEIVNTYRPEVVWSDGAPAPPEYWQSQQFLAWLYNDSPVKDTVVTNDRWGGGCMCKHGGYFTCMDRYNPGHLTNHKWENSMTIDRASYGFRREATLSGYLSMDELTDVFAETVSCGGNILMNVGPTHDGRIVPIFEERLRQMGAWLEVNGEAIYESVPWLYQNDTITKRIWYTSKNNSVAGNSPQSGPVSVYAIFLDWPADSLVRLGAPIPTNGTVVELLGYGAVPWRAWNPRKTAGTRDNQGILVDLSGLTYNQVPCEWAWTLKLIGLKQQKRHVKSAVTAGRGSKYRSKFKRRHWLHKRHGVSGTFLH